MLKLDERVQVNSRPTLAEWASSTLAMPEVRVQVRLRGNNLYLLCEGSPCPDVAVAVTRFAQSLAQTPIETLNAPDQPRIYQVFLSGRETGHNRPDWTVRLDPHQLDRYLTPASPPAEHPLEVPALTTTASTLNAAAYPATVTNIRSYPPAPPTPEKPAPAKQLLSVSPPSLETLATQRRARQGDADAIARYLSETLMALGVGVKVVIKDIPPTKESFHLEAPPHSKRLWVYCESAYSPDPSLLAEPIAQRLRELLEKRQGEALQAFHDAVIVGQVSGELRPEWVLRIDMTPPEQMLKAWACWGDVQAIAMLLNGALSEQEASVRAVLKDATLHLFCSPKAGILTNGKPQAPQKQSCMALIREVLEDIAPQGVKAATIYGVKNADSPLAQSLPGKSTTSPREETPAWVGWLDLPASKHPALIELTMDLAKRGNRDALTFLLDRLIHPNVHTKLATGGIKISLLSKGDLLHIIADAPVCPPQSRVASPITKFVRQLQIPNVSGVRIYGRRAGEKQPLWRYGADFLTRQLSELETVPDFAPASQSHDFLPQPGNLILKPTLKPIEKPVGNRLTQGLVNGVQKLLIQSQLFVPSDQPPAHATAYGIWVAIVWGTLGVLLTMQADWLVGQQLQTLKLSPQAINSISAGVEAEPPVSRRSDSEPMPLPQINLSKSQTDDSSVFNVSGFTENPTDTFTSTAQCPATGEAVSPTSCEIPTDYPSFNSKQLDEQLLTYQNYLQKHGTPDVLIVGSSRALRGVDPTALATALKEQGYPDVKVYNFGINGATAQVVDLVIRQMLPPEHLPKLIIWADGARAFNSGRADATYQAISTSEGYKQLLAGTHPFLQRTAALSQPVSPSQNIEVAVEQLHQSWTTSYDEIDQWINQQLSSISATYSQRDQLKTFLQQQWAKSLNLTQLVAQKNTQPETAQLTQTNLVDPEAIDNTANVGLIDENGFLKLNTRFNPVTYYQKHPQVSGKYDADYESFELAGQQTTAFTNLLQFTQEQQVPVVFINLPLTENYLDPIRNAYEQEFQEYMVRLALEKEFIFRDISTLWPTQNENFSDPSHLNKVGAYQVSQRLATDPMIPWPAN